VQRSEAEWKPLDPLVGPVLKTMDTTFERTKTEQVSDLFGPATKSGKDEWLTPPEIIKALGAFNLDPCAPIKPPWATAIRHYSVLDNGLMLPWEGRVWCNPPYGTETGIWLNRCAEHGNTIALTFARTETKMFFETVWDRADAVFFFKGRIKFYHVTGKQGDAAGAPSVLIAYGKENADSLERAKLSGKYIRLK